MGAVWATKRRAARGAASRPRRERSADAMRDFADDLASFAAHALRSRGSPSKTIATSNKAIRPGFPGSW